VSSSGALQDRGLQGRYAWAKLNATRTRDVTAYHSAEDGIMTDPVFVAGLRRARRNWGWFLVLGLILIGLGVAIAVDLIVHGFVWVMFALALRHVETVDFSGVSSAVRAD
jgi:hypothetical protein